MICLNTKNLIKILKYLLSIFIINLRTIKICFKAFSELRRNSIHYDIQSSRANMGEVVPTNYIDLGLFARKIGQQFEGDLKKLSDQLADSIDKMVIAKSLGVFKENTSGLSIYYPFKVTLPVFTKE